MGRFARLKSLGLTLPGSAAPKFICRICHEEFYETDERAREAHGAKCAAEHHDELVAEMGRKRPPAFFRPFDEEYAAWVRQHGRVR